ncbi:RNA polymerase sigma factor [Pseudobacter ginsenosidimutans]|uniref:RNA polymerase ECF family sigma subunit n=1 Tax=Pseudobacter ginsenosidimutans TaxID=661488 RepID=A0A4Q7N2Q0_9BACT|nr:sigma-70 family RNA polymerase sigma factor [Pseudobacter ginsenosidimutans]QEC43809.1 sigma-70 family RNA polymerase sigma factor [Pseudobacter ginsenosidimutans]RZS75229.1 RNA polymerase ECF family sigma subunit [Pseudobacter ginsenosidimutans]
MSNQQAPKLYDLIAQGDRQAFARAHAMFKTPLVYYAKRSIDDIGEVEDIISEAFLLLWQSREKFQSDNHLRNFLFITVRHKVLNYHTAKRRHEKILEKVYAGLDEGELASPDQVQTEMIGLIHRAVKQLPEEYRTVFDLSYSHDLSPKEIGQKLGINASTVRTQKMRALELIKKILSQKSILVWVLAGYLDLLLQLLKKK